MCMSVVYYILSLLIVTTVTTWIAPRLVDRGVPHMIVLWMQIVVLIGGSIVVGKIVINLLSTTS